MTPMLVLLIACGRVGFDGESRPFAGDDDGGGVLGGGDAGPTSGLVAWWTFDDGAGTLAADSSGEGNSATLRNGSPTWTAAGHVGGAIVLAGTECFEADAANGFSTSSFTFAAWINHADTGLASVMSIDGRTSTPWQQAWSLGIGGPGCSNCGSTIDFIVAQQVAPGNVSACLCGTTAIAPATWYHVAGVYDASVPSMDIDVDGQRDTGGFAWGPIPSSLYVDATYLPNIGEISQSYEFQGTLDDVRVYNRALSATELAALYVAGGG